MQANCATCGMVVDRPPSQIAKSKRIFCGYSCYFATRGQNYHGWRQGQRRARKVIAAHFDLQPSQVVHHEDSDNANNELWNLKVFANQSDHMKYHHGTPVNVLFDGRTVTL